jgi:hypothetical protein
MNYTPTTQWDRPPTDKELNAFYGKDKKTEFHDLIIKTLTQTVRNVSHKALSVPYIGYTANPMGSVMPYEVLEVFTDYGTDKGATLEAFVAMIEKSDCPLVAAWRMAVAKRFSDQNADELEEFHYQGDDE